MQVRKRPDTRKYEAYFTYEHIDGRKERVRKTTPFRNKKDAEAWAEGYKRDLMKQDLGQTVGRSIPILSEFAPKALKLMIDNKPSAMKSKKSILDNHLLSAFGEVPLDKITKTRIKEYRVKKLESGLSPKTINNHVSALARILSEAEEEGLITLVPRIKRLPLEETHFDFLTIEELNALFDAGEEPYRTMMIVAGKAGLRQGELLGLQWKDLDLDNGFLLVKRSIFRGVVGSTKSRKIRRVPLGDDVTSALIAQKHNRGSHVFCCKAGQPLTDNICKNPIRKACRLAGIRTIGWHVLRHTYASHLVQAGVDILRVCKYLGHSDVRVTMRYAHLAKDEGREAAKLLDTYSCTDMARKVIAFRK